jgi:DNA primase
MNQSEEIKTRLDIVDVIREYIQLKPAGVNFSARCPFHNEKSASFIVSPDKQIYHCFGCGKGGDVFSFVMEMEGLSFVEALRQLAPKAGIELHSIDNKQSSGRNRLLDAMAEAVNFYHKTLLDHPLAEPARDYLAKRGLTAETIEEWRIGFSLDDWDDLQKYLLGRGYKEQEIASAGLSSKKEGSNRQYNRFRGRIMFPINDINGNPVAFTARVSPEREATEKMGKYINSPQTPLFDKSKLLFGLDRAKQTIKQANLAILVEGQMDVITAHQHGYRNVVASSGTALTETQIILLKRFSENLALAFDSDAAGQSAIERGGELASQQAYRLVSGQDRFGRLKNYLEPNLTSAVSLRVIEMPNGKDPDECIRTDQIAWEQAVKRARPIMEYYFDKTLKKYDLKQVDGKRQAAKEFLVIIARLGSKIEQEAWIRKLAEALQISENLLFEALPVKKTFLEAQKEKTSQVSDFSSKVIDKSVLLSEMVLALVLRFPEHFLFLLNHFEAELLSDDKNRELYKNLIIYYNQNDIQGTKESGSIWDVGVIPDIKDQNSDELNYYGLKKWFETFATDDGKSQAAVLDRLVLLAEKEYYQLTSAQAKTELIGLSRQLRRLFLTNALKRVEADLGSAEKNNDSERIKLLMQEFKKYSEELKDLAL